jgi:hypothetical protein
LLCTSGLLNGVFGSSSERHVAYWESVKVVDRIEEDGEDENTTVIREKERLSQRLSDSATENEPKREVVISARFSAIS